MFFGHRTNIRTKHGFVFVENHGFYISKNNVIAIPMKIYINDQRTAISANEKRNNVFGQINIRIYIFRTEILFGNTDSSIIENRLET